VEILNTVQNPNESDLEEIDIEDFEFSDENVQPINSPCFDTPNGNADDLSDCESSDREDDLPLSELIKTTNSNIGGSAQNSKVWSAEKDNEFANNAKLLKTNKSLNWV
jgi:hypothetical protein